MVHSGCLGAVAFTVLLSWPQPGGAQQRATGRILGVFDDASSQPVTGAEVIDMATGTKALTSETGTISLAWLEAGNTVLQIRKVGYTSKMVTVVVSPSDTVSITVLLKPLGQALPEVRTTAAPLATGKLAEFERRRATGFGHFITRDQLDKMEGHVMSDVLRTIPGPKLMQDPRRRTSDPSAWYVGTTRPRASFLRSGPNGTCLAAIMLDGAMVYSGNDSEPPYNINTIRPDEIQGVEYYAGGATMPAEYNSTRNTCGLLVIWTR
jgi:hypothetical protein